MQANKKTLHRHPLFLQAAQPRVFLSSFSLHHATNRPDQSERRDAWRSAPSFGRWLGLRGVRRSDPTEDRARSPIHAACLGGGLRLGPNEGSGAVAGRGWDGTIGGDETQTERLRDVRSLRGSVGLGQGDQVHHRVSRGKPRGARVQKLQGLLRAQRTSRKKTSRPSEGTIDPDPGLFSMQSRAASFRITRKTPEKRGQRYRSRRRSGGIARRVPKEHLTGRGDATKDRRPRSDMNAKVFPHCYFSSIMAGNHRGPTLRVLRGSDVIGIHSIPGLFS